MVHYQGEEQFPDGQLTLRYDFAHSLYQAAFHDSLKPTKKAAFSALAAEALLQHYSGRTDEIVPELALLLEASRDFARAADAFLDASQKAARNYANQEAVELAKRSLRCSEKLNGAAHCARVASAALQLGYLRQALSQLEDSLADFEMSGKAAQEADDAEIQVLALCGASMSLQ